MRFMAMEYLNVQKSVGIEDRYLRVPNFSGFDQIAICPGGLISPGLLQKSSRSLLSRSMSSAFFGNFYIVDKAQNACQTVYGEGTFSYVPYFPGHFYYLYRGKEDKGKEFTYYDSSEEIRKLLITQFQSPLVSFNPLNVHVSREFVPHLTFSNSKLSFDFEEYEDKEDAGSTSIANEILSELLKNSISSEEKENVPQICNSILEELMLDVVSRRERCSLCFITHFPWLKVCRKNNKKKESMSIRTGKESTTILLPKLKGGARTPKFLITDSQNTQNLLTILRSLDVLSKHNGHDKCEIATGKNA